MTTLVEFMIISGTDNHPSMLEKSLYDSWSRMELYIENRENGRMILNSLQNGPLVWPTVVEEDGTTRTKKYEELSVAEKLQVDCQIKATNIVLQGLPPDVYAIVNHHKVAKEIWDRVKLLMQGTNFLPPEWSPVVPVFNQGDDPIACLNKAIGFLTAIASSRFPSTNNQLRTSSNPRNQATIQDGRVTVQQVQGRQGQSYASNSYKGNATSSGGNNAGGQILDEGKLAFLADPRILDGKAAKTTIRNTVAFQTEDLDTYDSDCDDVSNAKAVLMANLSNYGSDVILEVPHSEPNHTDMDNQSVHAMQAFQQTLVIDFIDNEITSDSNIILYSQYLQETQLAAVQETNLDIDFGRNFGKRFVPQQELSDEQAFWLQTSHPNTDQSASSPVNIEAPRELPMCLNLDAELLNKQNVYNDLSKSYSQLKNIAFLIKYFENNDLKAHLQAKDTTICKLNEHIKTMRENDKEEKVKHEMDEIETINIELEHSVAKLLSKNERLHKEIEQLKKIYKDQFDSIKKTRTLSKEHNDYLIAQLNSKSMGNADLKHQLQDKVFVITSLKNDLRKLKGKETIENATQIPIATIVPPGMFKLDLDPLDPRLLQNREARIYYLKHTQEQADILQGIELLVYVRDTCPNAIKLSEKKVAITPMNKVKKVRFSEPLTSSSNIKQVESSKTSDSNTSVLSSTGLKCFTSTCRSQPTSNKKNDMISQKPSSNIKNKVEVKRRRVKSKSNKNNHVIDPICDTNVKHTMLNANSELICVKCNQCMFDENHDVCFLDFVNNVNVHSKSKYAKKILHHNIWKPT
ncbi:hypothetical protein Tco_1247863, partial [Tanacetum coccineum]